MTYSSCLHDQQDLCRGNTSRDTSEESHKSQDCLAARSLNSSMKYEAGKGSYIQRNNIAITGARCIPSLTQAYETHGDL